MRTERYWVDDTRWWHHFIGAVAGFVVGILLLVAGAAAIAFIAYAVRIGWEAAA